MFIVSGDTLGGFYRATMAVTPTTSSSMKSFLLIERFCSSWMRNISLGVSSETIRYLGEDFIYDFPGKIPSQVPPRFALL